MNSGVWGVFFRKVSYKKKDGEPRNGRGGRSRIMGKKEVERLETETYAETVVIKE